MVTEIISYWFWIGTIYLFFLMTRELLGNEDDIKYNYIMLGITLSLVVHLKISLWFFFVMIIVITIINTTATRRLYDSKYNTTINWILLGLGFYNIWLLIFFIVFIVAFGTLSIALLRIKVNKAQIVFFTAFLCAGLIYGVF